MNFNHDLGLISSVLQLDTTEAAPVNTNTNTLEIIGTGSVVLPKGTTGERPGTPVAGMFRFNTTLQGTEYYDGTIWVQLGSGSGSVTSVSVDSASTGLQSTGSPITTAGTITLTLDATLEALSQYNTNGFLVQTAADTFAGRSIAGTAGNIEVTNGDGVAGNPTLDLANAGTPVVDSFVKITTDTKGRVTATTAVTTGDITALVDSTYVNVAGDTMTGTLTMTGGATVTGLPTPVNGSDATNKAYVDGLVSGLTWKNAVAVLSNADVSVASAPATIDGVSLTNGDRVLLIAQTTDSENGIYVFNGAGSPLTRAPDADTFEELNGAAVFVTQGTTFADTAYVQTAELSAFTGQTWVQFAGNATYVAGVGLDLTGNVFSVNLGAGITQLPSDEVGLHIYNYPGSAIAFATSGGSRVVTEASAVSGDLLALFLDGATLEQSGNGLKFRDSAALSVVGRDTNTGGAVVDIVAGADFQVLRRSGNAIAFGAIDLSQAGAVGTSILQIGNGGTGLNTIGAANTVLGVNAAGTALEYKSIVAGSSKIDVIQSSGTITIDAVEANFSLNNIGGTLGIAKGGTGQTTALGAFNALSPLTTKGDLLAHDGADNIRFAVGTNGQVLSANSASASGLEWTTPTVYLGDPGANGIVVRTALNTTTARAVTGTTDRITVTNGDGVAGNPTIDIASTYVGQPSITTVGTITAGTWNGTTVATGYGGTGLTSIGTANQFLSVNTGGTALEYKSIVAGTGITVTPAAGTLTISSSSTLELYRENPSTPVTPVATGTNAVAIGSGATASATAGFAQGDSSAARVFGMRAFANGSFAAAGDAQHGVYVLRGTTTNNVFAEVFLDGAAGTERITLPNNSLFTFSVQIAGRRTDATGGGAGYKFEGVIRKDATNASITFVGTPSKTVLGETNAPWDAQVVADTTTGSLVVNVRGENGKTVRWVATVLTTEVTN